MHLNLSLKPDAPPNFGTFGCIYAQKKDVWLATVVSTVLLKLVHVVSNKIMGIKNEFRSEI